jgi:ribosomal protein S18 acetylase RimI-like enzyme
VWAGVADVPSPLRRSELPIRELLRSDQASFLESIVGGYGPFEAMIELDRDGGKEFAMLFRPGFWYLIRFLRAVGRAPLRAFVVADHHQVVGTTLLIPLPNSGYLVGVGVRPSHRRRGLAGRLVARAEEESQRTGRAWAVLDVEEENHPAVTLYLARQYTTLARIDWLRTASLAAAGAVPHGTVSVRALTDKAQRRRAAAWVTAHVPASITSILPPTDRRLTHLETLGMAPGGKREVWEVGAPGMPRGVLSATWRGAAKPGMLFLAAMDAGATRDEVVALVQAGVAWLSGLSCSVILLAVPGYVTGALPVAAELGFLPQLSTLTMARRLEGAPPSSPNR